MSSREAVLAMVFSRELPMYKDMVAIAGAIETDGYDIDGFELVEIPHPKVFCFVNEAEQKCFDMVKFWDDRWLPSYIAHNKGGGVQRTS